MHACHAWSFTHVVQGDNSDDNVSLNLKLSYFTSVNVYFDIQFQMLRIFVYINSI